MRQLPFLGLILVMLCFVGCRQADAGRVLRLADKQVGVNVDSIHSLLAQIEEPSQLSGEERLLYGWLKTYVHYQWNNSMAEDSLILPAFDYYISQNDTIKKLLSYQLKASYLYWLKEYKQSMAVIDSGIVEAKALLDTAKVVDMMAEKAYWYVYVWKDYTKAIETFRAAIALNEKASLCFSMGVAMGLQKEDSASYYMNRSVELAIQAGDTTKIVHYLRNYAQLQAYLMNEYTGAIATIRRMEQYVDDSQQISMGDLVKVEVFLKDGLLDSAQYYLNRERKRAAGSEKFLTEENMASMYQAMIDYTRHRTFNVLDVMRYNDSVSNALYAVHSTLRRKDESKESLSQENLILTVERQEAQLTLLFSLLLLVLVGGGAFFYIRNRRSKLIEAEERVETLMRLLEDATKNKETDTIGIQTTENGEAIPEVEDGQFFRKILLKQLGIIRLVAKQPTSQNQELLRRISGITNHELPVESLLVWEDLYPVIDRVYDSFYTKMTRRFGEMLIDKEQQLCCLLCADFSTKEISVVTQQSIPTIYQRKTNIRKKLGMGEKEDVVEFILCQP
ncbi:hypothetical protein [Bacteroides sp.]|uniref:helix-turn-helix transcriptional regulator n=1 Tax=Bacteroides sp. TaxID=29523 RepID=UPI00262C4457|nr:hypothetical protein [Bacteroides sp.]